MSLWLKITLCVIACYLLGSVNGAIIVSKVRMHEDVRQKGSGNAGLTNFLRSYGGWLTLLVVVIDMGKVAVGCLFAQYFLPIDHVLARMIAGVAVQVGHIFPVFFGFHGGKGVLCTGTLAIVMNWKIAAIAFTLFLITFFATRYVSLGSFVGVVSFAAMLMLQYHEKTGVCILMAVMVVLVFFMHRGNIKRLLHGQERKTYFHKSKNEHEGDSLR